MGVLRPQSVGQLLDAAFDLIRFRPRQLMVIVALVVVPFVGLPTLLGVAQQASAGGLLEEFGSGGVNPVGDVLSTSGWDLVALLGGVLAQALAGVAVGRLVGAWVAGVEADSRAVVGFVIRKVPAVLAVTVLGGLLKGVAAFFCYVPIVLPITFLLVVAPALANEDCGPIRAMSRSFQLVGRKFGAVFFVFLASLLVAGVVPLAFQMLGLTLVGVTGGAGWAWALSGIITVGVAVLGSALNACWASLVYIDLRVRSEGLDLALRTREAFGS